jgi:hypothetical protein
MSTINLTDLAKRLNALKSNAKKSTHLWKPAEGKNVIRIVPYQYRTDDPFLELLFHYKVGKNKTYLSLETFNEKDPICEFAEKLKNVGDKESWIQGKKLEPTLRTYVPIIVRGKEKEGVKFWGFGKEIYQEILAIMTDPDYGDIVDMETGRDITVEFVSAKDAGNTYGATSIRPKPGQSKATDDATVLDMIQNKQIDIYDVFKKNTYEELATALEKWLTPDETTEAETETETETKPEKQDFVEELRNMPVEEEPVAKPVVKTPASNKVTATKTADVNEAFDELFNDK